ncbi:MAG: hypothetical protein GY715_13720 [Planctomycetes bacterium]|nr:hypothetical protein [Planctomycetota bacterium]
MPFIRFDERARTPPRRTRAAPVIMDAEPHMDLPRTVPTEEPIDFDLTCRRCGYNLRGLGIAGHCPECRAEVARSATPDLLRYSDVEWMRRTARGAHLLAVIVVVRIAVRHTILTLVQPEVFVTLITIALAALWAVAIWECTRRDPGHRPAPVVERARLGARILLIGIAALEIGLVTRDPTIVVDSIFTLTPGAASLLEWIFDALEVTAALLGFFLILTWARALADRIPDTNLATSTRNTRKGIAECYGVMAVLVAPWTLLTLVVTLPPRVVRIGDVVIGLVKVGATIGLLVCAVLAVILLFRYRAALVKAASESSEHWT